MIWESFSEFLHMHGYGLYVWGSFSLTCILIFWEIISLKNKKLRLFKTLVIENTSVGNNGRNS